MENRLIRSIKERIERFSFRRNVDPPITDITAEELSEKTGCGILTARIVTEAFPREAGMFVAGGMHIFNNFGIPGFITLILDRCREFPAQGYVPILEDCGGNMVMLPLKATTVDRVLVVGMDTMDPDYMELGETAHFYKGTLLDLLDQMLAHPRSSMFDSPIPFTGD